jgi:hypothetical protein
MRMSVEGIVIMTAWPAVGAHRGQLRVFAQESELAVHWQEVLWLDKPQHLLQLVPAQDRDPSSPEHCYRCTLQAPQAGGAVAPPAPSECRDLKLLSEGADKDAGERDGGPVHMSSGAGKDTRDHGCRHQSDCFEASALDPKASGPHTRTCTHGRTRAAAPPGPMRCWCPDAPAGSSCSARAARCPG